MQAVCDNGAQHHAGLPSPSCAHQLSLREAVQVQTVTISVEIIGKDLGELTALGSQYLTLTEERITDIPIPSYQWLASAYSLAFGSLLLLFGRLADIYGHKRAHLAG